MRDKMSPKWAVKKTNNQTMKPNTEDSPTNMVTPDGSNIDAAILEDGTRTDFVYSYHVEFGQAVDRYDMDGGASRVSIQALVDDNNKIWSNWQEVERYTKSGYTSEMLLSRRHP